MLRRTRIGVAASFFLIVSPLAGCATGGDNGRDAGRRIDTSPPGDAPGADVAVDGGGAGTIDGGGTEIDGGGTEIDGGGTELDAASGTDGGVPGTDAGPLPDVPGDRCAGVSCTVFDGPCSTGACDPATGTCRLVPRMEGLSCDDGDGCTMGDTCLAGACRSGAPRDCSAMTSACATGACSAGACIAMPLSNGTSCGTASCGTSSCMAGSCVAGAPAADCSTCGSGMYCSGGACGASPTTITYGFEGGALPAGWTNGVGGTTGWTVQATGAHGGTYRIRSGAIGDSAQSRVSVSIRLASAASLTFWLTTSSEIGYDFLQLYVDGALGGQWSGTTAWTQAGVDLAAGMHTIEWRYVKDVNMVGGSDLVAIDDVVIGPPVGGSTGFESTSLPAGYTSSGDLPWVTDTVTPHGGARSAASGLVGDEETSSMFRTVSLTSAATLTYWYRVSTEATYDFLRVFIDGTMAGQWSGTVAWTMSSHPLAAGTHTVEWRYVRDVSLGGGSNRVWIDDVDFGPAPVGGPLCGP